MSDVLVNTIPGPRCFGYPAFALRCPFRGGFWDFRCVFVPRLHFFAVWSPAHRSSSSSGPRHLRSRSPLPPYTRCLQLNPDISCSKTFLGVRRIVSPPTYSNVRMPLVFFENHSPSCLRRKWSHSGSHHAKRMYSA